MANNELKRKSLAMQEGPLSDEMVLADETLRYHFGLNGGAGPVSAKGWGIINAVLALIPAPAQGGLSDALPELPDLPNFTMACEKGALFFSKDMLDYARAYGLLCRGQQGGSDAARLDFVLDRQAFILTIPESKTGRPLMYQLMEQDEDEDYHVLSGEGEAFRTKREAIDAAIQAQAGDAPKGEKA